MRKAYNTHMTKNHSHYYDKLTFHRTLWSQNIAKFLKPQTSMQCHNDSYFEQHIASVTKV